MKVLIEGTLKQVRQAAAVIAAPRDRTKYFSEAKKRNEKNRYESNLMRAAYLAVKDDSTRRALADQLASAIYGERTDALIDVAKALTTPSWKL